MTLLLVESVISDEPKVLKRW